ncbi:MAG: shikimate dehydrogenase [Candidatus Omnitrophica bacterium]|nr:shikimate dehydrogenase [Candidatus Omnitrophota bacterium]
MTEVRLFAVIGDPIEHSLSPLMQNAAFRAASIKAFYFAWRVRKRDLGKALRRLRSMGVAGFNVTLPHKEAILKHLDGVERRARRLGAVNTVCVRKGRFIGYNTDLDGFLRSLKADLKFDPRGRRAVVLGAGGAARAAGFALSAGGVRHLVVANRHRSRAEHLARELKRNVRPPAQVQAVSFKGRELCARVKEADLVVNATRLGLNPGDPLPVPVAWLQRGQKVLDLVYGPGSTRFVRLARRRGAAAQDGLGMLAGQGAASFKLWTRRRAPVMTMRRVLKAAVN